MATVDRFWRSVDKGASDECWLWTGYTIWNDYGVFMANGKKNTLVHRFAYEEFVGPIPDGLHIDHLCRVRNCVNPAHMEPVTPGENARRGSGPTAVNATKTHCKRGHEFTPDNTYDRPDGGRECKTCRRIHSSNRAARRSSPSTVTSDTGQSRSKPSSRPPASLSSTRSELALPSVT